MADLSVLIPARNEMFLARTVEDILAHIEANTEVIVVLDGAPALSPLPDDSRVRVIELAQSIGQRAATNLAARQSTARYVMKSDAHCAFGQGFDRIMLEDMQDDWTMVPTMYNLHAFDWVCRVCRQRKYQGPTPDKCAKCGGQMEREMIWRAKPRPESTAMRFDRDLKFQYWSKYKRRQSGEMVETMSLLGACWLLTREKYWELDICDEGHGSWGQQGTEVACKTWLSGGRLVCTRKTWFAHLFRTQGGDFGFPYSLPMADVEKARAHSRWLWLGNNWPGARHALAWLIAKFAPVPDWERPVTKAILYYTCNTHDERIELAARRQLATARNGHELGCVSLQPTEFGDWNITLPLQRCPQSMHTQILAGLERLTADVVFLAESDVLYHPSHFKFTPQRDDVFYYNTNVWKVRMDDGHAVWTDDLQQVSGLCAHRTLLIDFYRKRVEEIEREGWNNHYEPGPKQKIKGRAENWQSAYPNLDIRHGKNLTRSKWSPGEFRNPSYAKGWKEAGEIPGWGRTEGRFDEFLMDVKLGRRE